MQQRVDGVVTELGKSQTFDVVSIREPTLDGSTQEQRVVFEMQLDELIRATDGTVKSIDEISAELDAIKQTLVRSTVDASIYELADRIQENLLDQRDRLSSNEARSLVKEWDAVSLQERLFHARFVGSAGAYGPTPLQRRSYDIGRRLYEDTVTELRRIVDVEYAALKKALDEAGVPWTPGRGIQ